MIALALLGCGSAPEVVDRATGGHAVLSELPFVELDLPRESRDGAAPPATSVMAGPWRSRGPNTRGRHQYTAPLPFRPRGLFFHAPEPGMALVDASGAVVPYALDGGTSAAAWSHDRDTLSVWVPDGAAPPGALTLAWPLATERERALNLAHAALPPDDFARATVTIGWDSRRGVLLPAPGRVAWDLVLPPAAELTFASGLVPPELAQGAPSDGATLTVSIEVDGEPTDVFSDALDVATFHDRRIDLSAWSGRAVRLRLTTAPGPTARFDYALVAAPVVASRVRDPRRVVLVFVDTLRPDHLSLYGYGRDTSGAIDGLAATSAVFRAARSVAPWTLPSARTVVTGRYPEYYAGATTLPDLLRAQGFATAFLAGNVYLSSSFDMHRGWDLHRVAMLPQARETTDEALAWLEAHAGRDALLQVHYMSTHLPYLEPASYRTRYAGSDGPPALRGEIALSDVRSAGLGADPAGRAYLRDRYDGAIRYTTDQIARLVERLGPDDVLVLFSDHGEELWDHGGFEHGHTLFEELLRVPLVIRGRGVRPGSIDAPVSLLDVAPTVLDLLELAAPPEMEGRSLAPLLRGEPGAPERFAARPLAVGHPLYGADRWGVIRGTEKWTIHQGQERVVDLSADPGERLPGAQNDLASWHERLTAAVGRPARPGWRLAAAPHPAPEPPGLRAECTVEGGFDAAFPADDPLGNSRAVARVTPVGAEACWSPDRHGAREVYLVPRRPADQVGAELRCVLTSGDERAVLTAAAPRARIGGRDVALGAGVAPAPDARTAAIEGTDAEVAGMLAAIGYVTGDAADLAGEGADGCHY